MPVAVHDLEILDGVFNVDHAPGAEFHVDGSTLDQLLDLLSAQLKRSWKIPRNVAINVAVAMCLDLPAQREIACHVPELDQGLPFKRCRESLLAVIAGDFVERVGEQAFAAMGTKTDVEVEDALLLGFDPLQELLCMPLEVLAVLDAVLAGGAAGSAVDEQYFDVRGITQFPPAEFTHPEDREGAGPLIGQSRSAVLLGQ